MPRKGGCDTRSEIGGVETVGLQTVGPHTAASKTVRPEGMGGCDRHFENGGVATVDPQASPQTVATQGRVGDSFSEISGVELIVHSQ